MNTSSELIEQLLPAARQVADNAYAPYSGIQFGAAALSRDGRVFTGCNVENASYSLTQCAERNALGAAISGGVKRGEIVAMLIFTPGGQSHTPCGACRQVLVELLAEDSPVMATSDHKESITWNVSELLPNAFEL